MNRWRRGFSALVLVATLAASGLGCSSDDTSSGGGTASANLPTPQTQEARSYIAVGSDLQAVPLFPAVGRFYAPGDDPPAGPARRPWYEFLIRFEPAQGTKEPPFQPPRLYLSIFCDGHIDDPQGCEDEARQIDLGKVPASVKLGLSLQTMTYKGVFYDRSAVRGTLRINRKPGTARPDYDKAKGLIDTASKFQVRMENVEFAPPSSGQGDTVTIPRFEGELWGDSLFQ